jgi:heme-degrading monooxygenase HmoA
MLLEFFKALAEKPTGMKGFLVMDDIQDFQESVVITFWERKEDMDEFYESDNKALTDLVEKLKPSFEQLPIRKDYQVARFKV